MEAYVHSVGLDSSMSRSDGSKTGSVKVDVELCILREYERIASSGGIMVVVRTQDPPVARTFRSSRFFEEIPGLSTMLSSFGIEAGVLPREVKRQIYSYARHKLREAVKTENNELKIGLEMNIKYRVALDHDAALEQALRESLEDSVRLRAAPEASIGNLKKMRYDGEELGSDCRICLDDFLAKEDVTVMPCGHGFHSSCIVRWLKTANSCPVCRLQL